MIYNLYESKLMNTVRVNQHPWIINNKQSLTDVFLSFKTNKNEQI